MNLHTALSSLLIGLILSLFGVQSPSQKESVITVISGSIEGTAILAPKNRPVRFGGGLYGRSAPSASSQSSSDSILVVLKGTPSNIASESASYFLNQKDQQFVPSLLAVKLGGMVRIQNSDPVYHNVFSLTSPHKFDVGRRPKGEHFDVTFEKPGVVDVFCDIHSNMHAIIYVLPENAVAWTKIKSGDTFSFSDIEDGSYELTLYALGYQESTSQIDVQSGQTYQTGTITLNP
ncbi:MAG: hypothetical protein JJ971_04850 [Balneolaceae bacterium]|nr:hypothetical protein [Balneolaceae bacterium]MBO6545705.1 hypothetical protein [Balneolaceae bacterium]MBO6647101.1 hypothetical protein [Balneolaceae bacterium]